MKKTITLLSILLLGCLSLFANDVKVRKLTDKNIMSLEMNYEFVDSCDCNFITENCIIQGANAIVFMDKNSKSIRLFTYIGKECNLSAKDCLCMVNNGNVQNCILYKEKL